MSTISLVRYNSNQNKQQHKQPRHDKINKINHKHNTINKFNNHNTIIVTTNKSNKFLEPYSTF